MEKPRDIPHEPGVYLFKDNEAVIIYVGKAKNLKNRVSSYFNPNANHSPKTKVLVNHITNCEFIIVDNEIEALLLENRLIKKHTPRYNISLKDSKTYAYILVTQEEYPRILTSRTTTRKGKYFGPYTDGGARYESMQLAIKLFKIRICQTLPKRACLNYHIGLCTAPCINAIGKEEYQKQVQDAMAFLGGETKPVVKRLMQEMKNAAATMQYEIAAEKKRQLEAIEILGQKQKVDLVKQFDQDVIALHEENNSVRVTLFSIKKGVILGKKEFRFESQEDLVEQFVTQYYATQRIPEEILVGNEFWKEESEREAIEGYLAHLKGGRVVIHCPQRGEKLGLVRMAEKNAQFRSYEKVLEEMQEKLLLPSPPRVIECFDISNLGYDYIVGAMTQWVDCKPNKSAYRRFEIHSTIGKNDDFTSMHEVVLRRYTRLRDEKEKMPDLIIIDGGLGQLNAALGALRDLGVVIPIISLAKKEEEIYRPGEDGPLRFEKNSEMMLLIRRIRDSVHDFVLSYNRKKRQMRMKEEFKS